MAYKKTVLIIPPNDAEAVMIQQIAQKLGLPIIESKQFHGSSLDKGHDYVKDVKDGGYSRVIVVEMPGLKAEKKLRKMGVKLDVIDHHHYTGLSRAHDEHGKLLPSSLEQFLKMFKVTDAQLTTWGYKPKLVRGIGIQDRGYVWALQDEGYSKEEIQDVMAFHDSLVAHLHNPKTEARKEQLAKSAWDRKKKWREFFVISTRADIQLRPRLSRIVVQEIGKPTPMIIVEHGRGLIYVQESPYAIQLFERFGGFTFGLDRNWGHKNEKGKKQVTLREVKQAIETVYRKVV
ncbi:hypothetical protein COV05_02010 [Candidatus Uhrbacteria bacterium CG10_big_fil_rev_8_21_14_0_10_48_16]|uniref:Uncharacterized protein n=1 Tax=Candidatus Uhrbacteria bacterium CG10_big_fil_rev_8_21_14_0_10_48_16 TaxID=1975038 RepID=A0A2M8LHQ6_9BACT|nr:MAG: hypothetical protein COV05_02010 [Candidatus Uhrbacteria bacterium CG10_big_fil_rev_8_21_14_0_10_48_16]